MEEIKPIDMRISKLISLLTNHDGADLDGDVACKPKNIVLKDSPAACRVLFNEMKHILFEDCHLLSHSVIAEIIKKNDT